MSEFRLPSLGADMEEATLREWFVKPGDSVKKGDIIAAVETNKGIIDIEVYESGTLDKILVPVDEKVPVGAVLAMIRGAGGPTGETEESSEQTEPETGKATAAEESAPPVRDQPTPPVPELAAKRKPISPAARKRARELGIDPETVRGTGPGGAVTLEDVSAGAGPAAPVQKVPAKAKSTQGGMRHAIALAMARSKKEIPHYYLSTSIDLSTALSWLESRNAERPLPQRAVYAVLLLKAVAVALKKVPELNGFYLNGEAQLHSEVHPGIAISLRGGGLVVPALHNVQDKDLDSLMEEFSDLVSRARGGHLRSSELQDATITVNSLGEQGVETVFPIIYPPQLAIIGFGSIVERFRPVDGKPQMRRIINASLAADHRASDGHRGGLFLAEIDRLLQEPEKL